MEIPFPAVTVTESRQRQSALMSAQQQQEESQDELLSGDFRKYTQISTYLCTHYYRILP
jgi:hypothetical protein